MSRYRLLPSAAQEALLREHCAHARYVWNLAVEQHSWWRPGRTSAPGYCAQAAQLTGARRDNGWLDWAEKASTKIARRYDVIRIEDLRVANMTRSARGTTEDPGRNVRQKAGLNRAILNGAWSLFATRLEHKAPGRIEKISPAFTSQRCSACGHVAAGSRKSQALFACVACHFTLNADLNAARNIAAGHAVTARGGDGVARPVNREPQLLAS